MRQYNQSGMAVLQWLWLLMLGVSLSSCGYNELVRKDEAVKAAWAQVENAYQRRADLIPALVKTVKGAANYEKSTLEAVVAARAAATGVSIKADELTPENIAKYQRAQGELSSSLGRLLAISENYPELKANQNYLDLQTQLERTENRISVERMKFNQAVQDYNTYIRKFPTNLIASFFNYQPKGYFQAEADSNKMPEIDL
jgi:LemA protein